MYVSTFWYQQKCVRSKNCTEMIYLFIDQTAPNLIQNVDILTLFLSRQSFFFYDCLGLDNIELLRSLVYLFVLQLILQIMFSFNSLIIGQCQKIVKKWPFQFPEV